MVSYQEQCSNLKSVFYFSVCLTSWRWHGWRNSAASTKRCVMIRKCDLWRVALTCWSSYADMHAGTFSFSLYVGNDVLHLNTRQKESFGQCHQLFMPLLLYERSDPKPSGHSDGPILHILNGIADRNGQLWSRQGLSLSSWNMLVQYTKTPKLDTQEKSILFCNKWNQLMFIKRK